VTPFRSLLEFFPIPRPEGQNVSIPGVTTLKERIRMIGVLSTIKLYDQALLEAAKVSADKRRSDFLRSRGYRVLRFWDNEVMENIDAALEQIVRP
jgi:Protein of unknown function (DUF559)